MSENKNNNDNLLTNMKISEEHKEIYVEKFNIGNYFTDIFKYKLTHKLFNFTCYLIVFLGLFGRFMLDMNLDKSSVLIIFTGFVIIGLTLYYNLLQSNILDIYDYDNEKYIEEEKPNILSMIIKLVLTVGITVIVFKEFYAFLYTIHMIINTVIFFFITTINILYTWIRMIIDELLLIPNDTFNIGTNLSQAMFKPEKVADSTFKALKDFCMAFYFGGVAYTVIKEFLVSMIFIAIHTLVGMITAPLVIVLKSGKLLSHTFIYFCTFIFILLICVVNIIKRIILVAVISIISLVKDTSQIFDPKQYIKNANSIQSLNDLKLINYDLLNNDLLSLDINTMRLNDVKVINKGIEAIDNIFIKNINKGSEKVLNKLLPKSVRSFFANKKYKNQKAKEDIKEIASKYNINDDFTMDTIIEEIRKNIPDINTVDLNPDSGVSAEEYLIEKAELTNKVENDIIAVMELVNIIKETQEIPIFFTISDKAMNFNGFLYSSEFIEYLHHYKVQNTVSNLGLGHIFKFFVLIVLQTLVMIWIFIKIVDNNQKKIRSYNRESKYFYNNSILVLYVIIYILIYMIVMKHMYITIKGGYVNVASLDNMINKFDDTKLTKHSGIQIAQSGLEEQKKLFIERLKLQELYDPVSRVNILENLYKTDYKNINKYN